MSFPSHPRTPDGPTPAQPGGAAQQGNGMAVAALVLGIAALLLFWTVFGGLVLGLLAVVLGVIGARRARAGHAARGTMAVTGAVLGALGLIASAVILVIGASVIGSEEYKDFDECLRHAPTQSEREACAREFDKDISD
ncbi:DUF4190 domain-containing protein [Streptomyces sp. NPDC012888]|uniref:DUF4190 domain-containing protein n=1 Tax=Streptomyces sp. NPDC012888 TaxID=3364855 RepID=UPI0036C8EAA6